MEARLEAALADAAKAKERMEAAVLYAAQANADRSKAEGELAAGQAALEAAERARNTAEGAAAEAKAALEAERDKAAQTDAQLKVRASSLREKTQARRPPFPSLRWTE